MCSRKDISISQFSTKELVKELGMRAGVKQTIAAPYEDINIKVNGPAIVLEIVD